MQVDKKFTCENPLTNFVDWLLNNLNAKFKTIAFSHNGGRYDMQFVFKYIYNLGGLQPEIIKQGNKMFEIKVQKKGIPTTLFHDSYNFIPLALSKLVKTFELDIEEKMFFPHLFNVESNYGVICNSLPPKEDYLHYKMMPSVREKFELWYEAAVAKGADFNLCEKLPEYCLSVSIILCFFYF